MNPTLSLPKGTTDMIVAECLRFPLEEHHICLLLPLLSSTTGQKPTLSSNPSQDSFCLMGDLNRREAETTACGEIVRCRCGFLRAEKLTFPPHPRWEGAPPPGDEWRPSPAELNYWWNTFQSTYCVISQPPLLLYHLTKHWHKVTWNTTTHRTLRCKMWWWYSHCTSAFSPQEVRLLLSLPSLPSQRSVQ